MKTKYVKVPASESPENDERYFAWIDNPNADSYIDPDNYNRTTITAINGEFKSFYNVTHYLKEVPDHSEEMLSMLERIRTNLLFSTEKGFDKPLSQEEIIKMCDEMEGLINKVKNEV
ncbi:hypothetical protein KRE40_03700 [Elizabethkingia meningoseptica]|uniref:hypothetical protein n=1 Tax=Elizabethkingia meningoseptica TaxID=238 RepID=UPI0023AE8877|nr:hypothetical protein [Elizabethkingia meningoseptica]MDE5507755.1 hypothetical protein [Elizabethkingia meningoseptica]MDE5516400.1 hypothetical protein [Elizabethkingia meningoseptica]MDE5526645.1 hypothetical protein [Elizabethkingia meningoseptica]MDN4033742.1 hypothetical protein [Elizabethkingia meningoseptica]